MTQSGTGHAFDALSLWDIDPKGQIRDRRNMHPQGRVKEFKQHGRLIVAAGNRNENLKFSRRKIKSVVRALFADYIAMLSGVNP